MDTVSIIIPTFNRADKVVGAVRSALAQTWPACEVIVVDDGSTDATEQVLAPFGDRIRYVKKENGGVSSARNRGIREATGQWVAFLDSDDSWEPGKLLRQVECMKRAGARVCFCVSTDESGEPIDDLHRMDPALEEGGCRFYQPDDCRLFKWPRHPFLQSMVVGREALLKAGAFDESLRVAEDTKLIYGLILAHGYVVLNERLVHICRDREEAGLSDSRDAASAFRRHDCYIRVQAEVLWRLVPLDGEAAAVVRRNMYYFVSRQAEIACALGRRDEAKRYARFGLSARAGWKCLLRNLLVLGFHPVVRPRFARKWRVLP